jgi:eukaryotic-like serine/threonine-protein kinase
MASETVLNGRYRLVAQQGSGGMAVIYKAIDQALGRTVAVKILRPSLTDDPSFLARFRNEARSVANLAHPNIVTVHDVGNDGPTHYIVMEFIEGQDLKKVIRTDGATDIDRALHLGIQICAGIGFAHRAGLVHADVKPQNILVTRDDIVKVTDFGIAQALSEAHPGERQSVVWGSPHYFAPEQARGERPSPASDVYSIGIVLFEMLTGRLPYTGQNQQELALAHIRDRVPVVTEFNPRVPEPLASIVYKVMSKEPAMRYRMADQLGNILSSYRDRRRQELASGSAPARPVVPPTQPNQPVIPPPQPQQPAQIWPPQQQQVPIPPAPQIPVAPPIPYNRPNDMQTRNYGLAPEAPQVPNYSRSAGTGYIPPQPYTAGNSPSERLSRTGGVYNSRPYEPEVEPPASTFDPVTIALALLAFVSVACLIPLYIAVFQAHFGR